MLSLDVTTDIDPFDPFQLIDLSTPDAVLTQKNGAKHADPEVAKPPSTSDDATTPTNSSNASEHGDLDVNDATTTATTTTIVTPATLNAVHLALTGSNDRDTADTTASRKKTTKIQQPRSSPRSSSLSSSVPSLTSASSNSSDGTSSPHNSPLSPPLSEPPSSNNTSPASRSRVLPSSDRPSSPISTPSSAATAAAAARTAPSPITPDNNSRASATIPNTPSPSPGPVTINCASLSPKAEEDQLPTSDMDNQGGTRPVQTPTPLSHTPHPVNGKGGCWTCRIRRKKCDEQRIGDSCQTCIRLRIDCLGWGPKRPQWMRDKQAVEQYKAGIKEKLIKAGMVRGQPRAPVSNAGSSSTSSSSRTAAASNDAGPGPSRRSASGAHAQTSSHYTPYPSPHQYGSHGAMLAAAAAAGAGLSPMLDAQQQFSGILPSLMGAGDPSASLTIDYAREISQPGVARRSSYSQTSRLATQQQQLTMRMTPGRGSISSGTSSPHGSMASPFDFASQNPNVSPHQAFQGQQLLSSFSSPDLGLGMGNIGVDMMGNPAGMSTPNLNTEMSMGLGAGNDSMLFAHNVQGGFGAHQQQQMQQRMPPPSRPSTQSTTLAGPSTPTHQMFSGEPPFNSALMDENFLHPHVMYYFDSVLPMQYLFQQKNAAAVIQDLLRSEPLGALTNASCALASLHNKTLRVSRMLEQPDPIPEQSTAAQLYNRGFWLLANKTSAISASLENPPMAGGERPSYSVAEVIGALHCVAYFLMQGGTGDWAVPMTAARYWLEKTMEGVEDPKRMYLSMSEAERLAVKMTIWYDTLSAISLQQAPRFVDLCRRLLTGAQQGQNDDNEMSGGVLHMEQLMGCPDAVFLVLIETAALAYWKEVERARGSLSTRELLRRGDTIEDLLRTEKQRVDDKLQQQTQNQQQMVPGTTHEHTTSSHMHLPRPSGEHNAPPPNAASQVAHGNVVNPAAGAAGASVSDMSAMLSASISGNISGSSSTQAGGSTPTAQTYRTNTDLFSAINAIFCETANLYLQLVVNEPSANVPEVGSALASLMQALHQLPPSASVERALTLPLALAAFVADDLAQRESLKRFLTTPDPSIGNARNVRVLAEHVWSRRDHNGGVVDWRVIMRDVGWELLLV